MFEIQDGSIYPTITRKEWKELHVSTYSDIPEAEWNRLFAGASVADTWWIPIFNRMNGSTAPTPEQIEETKCEEYPLIYDDEPFEKYMSLYEVIGYTILAFIIFTMIMFSCMYSPNEFIGWLIYMISYGVGMMCYYYANVI